MRILRVAQNVYPEVPGGGTYHVHAMSRDQAAMGHDVTVLTVTSDDSLPRQEERDGYTVVRRRPTMKLLGNDISVGVARFLRRARNFDIVHAHSHLYFSTNLAALKRYLNETPLAITNHGLYSQTAPEWVFDVYLRTLGRLTLDTADVVFTYTDEDRRRLEAFGVDTSIAVVANGIDQTRFTPDGPTSERIDADGPVVLFVGRLVEGKRPNDALEAFVGVQDEIPNAELYLCGDGPLRKELERRTNELGISDAVTFLGHVSYDEMPNVYRAADVLVLPSRAEGLPRTVLEAFASKTPVVASDLEHVAPIVDEAGETVPVGHVDGFEYEIRSLLGDPERRRTLGETGQSKVEERFRWQDTVAETTAELERLLR